MGDIFMATPFPAFLSDALQTEVTVTRAYMRDFYRNAQKRFFDAAFLREINASDLFVIGGGLYFDVRWDYSHTGTTLNFSDDFIEGINVPVIINGLGYAEPRNADDQDPAQKEIFDKFRHFIENVSARKNWFLTLRNDGSKGRIAARYGDDFAALFTEIPDNGFFFEKGITPHVFDEQLPTIGFSIGNDSFTPDQDAASSAQRLNEAIAEVLLGLVAQDKRVLFFPHMPRDIDAISQILRITGVEGFRRNVAIAPYNPAGALAGKELASYYRACDAVVAMRFHANIISLQNIIPTIGLVVPGIVSGERIAALYHDLRLEDQVLSAEASDQPLAQRILTAISELLSHPESYIQGEERAMADIMQRRGAYGDAIRAFMERNRT